MKFSIVEGRHTVITCQGAIRQFGHRLVQTWINYQNTHRFPGDHIKLN